MTSGTNQPTSTFETVVLDDLVPPEVQDVVHKFIIEGPWRIITDYPASGFRQHLKSGDQIISPLFVSFCEPLLERFAERVSLKIDTIPIARAFLQLPLLPACVVKASPHVDMRMPHIVLLYYTDDADGETIIYDQQYQYDPSEPNPTRGYRLSKPYSPLSVHEKVLPRKGRVVAFDGSRYHRASSPIHGQRCLINFNLCLKDEY